MTEGAAPAPACLVVGADLRVVSDPSPLQPWSTLVSSDPAVLRCVSGAQPHGVVAGICHSVRPGVVVVSTGTAPFAGDPHGPAQYLWQITITVIG